MKLTSLVFLSTLPLAFVAVLAGAPALPTLAFTAPVLLIAMAVNDYNRSAPRYQLHPRTVVPVRRRQARLPLAA